MAEVRSWGYGAQQSEPGSHGLLSHLADLDTDSSRVLVALLFLLLLGVDTFKLSLVRKEKLEQETLGASATTGVELRCHPPL